MLNKLEKAKQDYDIEIGLFQKEKCQLDVCVANLTEERSNFESELERKQNEILKLETQLSDLQCELQELKAQYGKCALEYVNKCSDITKKHKEEVEDMKNNFWKEKEELLIENEIYKTHASKMETKANKMEETNCSLVEELKNLQRYHKDVRDLCKYAIKFLFICVCIYICIYLWSLGLEVGLVYQRTRCDLGQDQKSCKDFSWETGYELSGKQYDHKFLATYPRNFGGTGLPGLGNGQWADKLFSEKQILCRNLKKKASDIFKAIRNRL